MRAGGALLPQSAVFVKVRYERRCIRTVLQMTNLPV